MRKFITMDGGSVEFTPVSGGMDVRTRNAIGETISTVVIPANEAALYMAALAAAR